MGEIIVKKWRCDRCGATYHNRPPKASPEHTVTATQHHEWAGGFIVQWKEMCPPCEAEVEDGLRALAVVHHSSHGDAHDR